MSHPLVSIGIPVLNGELWLHRSLDALLDQDYPNIEILISDNASTDSSLAICTEYEANNRNIKIIRQTTTLGISDNFGAVLKPASGKYFMWAAVDDFWDPTFVSSLVNVLENRQDFAVAQSGTVNVSASDLTCSISDVRFTKSNNPENCSTLQLTGKIVSPLKYNLYIYGLFRTELLKEAHSFCPNVPSSDRWFLLQLPLAGYRFGYVDKPLYIRTIQELPVYLRYQDDAYAKQVEGAKGKWFDFSALPAVKNMLNSSSMLSNCSTILKTIVLLQLFYGRSKIGIMLMTKATIMGLLPKSIAIYVVRKIRAHLQLKRGTFK